MFVEVELCESLVIMLKVSDYFMNFVINGKFCFWFLDLFFVWVEEEFGLKFWFIWLFI